jgi:hypothetical protein
MKYDDAKKIMGKNFVGVDEINSIAGNFNLENINIKDVPTVPFSEKILNDNRDSILILGVSKHKDNSPLTLNSLRDLFGIDPEKKEPCFYNQDWYLKQGFANEPLEFKWYLVKKNIEEKTRGEEPEKIIKSLSKEKILPKAVLTAFVFFVSYFLNKEVLWKEDFVWCSDLDDNGDRIYTGRYTDPAGKNKNGFNVHRHLSIRSCYGAVFEIN